MEQYNKTLLTQNNGLTTYYYFDGLFTEAEITKIKELASKQTMQDGNLSGTNVLLNYRSSKVCWFDYSNETKFIYDKLITALKTANTNVWNFNITSIIDPVQFSEYTAPAQGHYDWHMDFGNNNSSTRKLSVSVQLTDPSEYEGGDLEFMIHRDVVKAPKSKGTMVVFPSYLQHRVTQVTKGTRHSLVFWIHGPPFK